MATSESESNCDVGMDGIELQSAVARPGSDVKFHVIPCQRDAWRDIQVYVLQGIQLEASPDVFVEEGIRCKLRDTSTRKQYKILCQPFASVCTSRNVTVAMIGQDATTSADDGIAYRFVNESAYPFAAEIDRTGQHCVKKCQTDAECHRPRDPYGSPRGAWCNPKGKFERCPDECGYTDGSLRYPPAALSGDECLSGLCCNFGMDGSEMIKNYRGEYYAYWLSFSVLPCPSSSFVDNINVYILKGLHTNASPQTFVSDGHQCTSTMYNGTEKEDGMGISPRGPFSTSYTAPPINQYQIFCRSEEYMRSCQTRKHTIAMVGTDPEGNFHFVNETAYPLAGKFDSSSDGCSVRSSVIAIVCVPVAVVVLLILFCRYKKKGRETST